MVVDGALRKISYLVAQTLRVPIALISLVRDFDGQDSQSEADPLDLLRNCAFVRQSAEQRTPLIIADICVGLTVQDLLYYEGAAIRAYVGLPILARDGTIIGVLSIFSALARQFAKAELALLSNYAVLAGDFLDGEQAAAQSTAHVVAIEQLSERNSELQRQIVLAREMERKQLTATRRLQCFADAVPATICYWGRDLKLEFANVAAHAWFKASEGSPLGKPMQELQGAELFLMNEPYVRLALNGIAQQFERKRNKSDGTPAILEVQYLPDFDDSTEVRGFYVLVTDITVLRAARDEALELVKAKAEFLANMSHEIRTPLNGVLGTTRMLLETTLTNEQRELAETSLSSSEHLLALVNDILDFSKMDSGSLTLERIDFDLTAAVSQACGIIEASAGYKGLSISVDIRVTHDRRMGDPMRLRQVLLNLLGNAIKFTSAGGVEIRVDEVEAGCGIMFSVSDTGIGISPESLPRLFERFTQADSSTSRRFGGSGLGLAISQRLVGLMGGTLCVSSELGRGSRFWFSVELPMASASAVIAALVIDEAERQPIELQGLRVLVAEDNAVNQLLVRKMLLRLGCEVTIAANGSEAVQSWLSHNFDVVLMDCQMPEMDGVDATRHIRSSGAKGAVVPIIALTAGALQTDREQALLAGMSDFLTKPLLAKTLELALCRAMSLSRDLERSPHPPFQVGATARVDSRS
jgi:signal transduction histidine kinase/ActR/RegA family two-component response regulator